MWPLAVRHHKLECFLKFVSCSQTQTSLHFSVFRVVVLKVVVFHCLFLKNSLSGDKILFSLFMFLVSFFFFSKKVVNFPIFFVSLFSFFTLPFFFEKCFFFSFVGYGNSCSWSDGGSWSSKSHKSSNRWKNYLVCEGCHNWVYEHRVHKNGFMCTSCGTAPKPAGSDPVANAELVLARGARWLLQVQCRHLNLLSNLALIARLSGILQRWSTKLGNECAFLRKRVRRWRQSRAGPQSTRFS